MSAPVSSSQPTLAEPAGRFVTWPGLLSLSLGLTLGPVVALVHQQIVYAVNMWACGHNRHGVMHVVPVLCLIVVAGTVVASRRNWIAVGRGVEDEDGGVATRTRFLALLGIAISVFSGIVIAAQWLAIFIFAPCQRA
jgi:hypothetical protein